MLPAVMRCNKPVNAERQMLVGAMETPWVPRNPRQIAGLAEVCEILELAR
jgi:hypothetical protein